MRLAARERSRAKNPPANKPSRRWQNPQHSAKDDEAWDDLDEMEIAWGRGGITRSPFVERKWQGKWPLRGGRRSNPRDRECYDMPPLISDSSSEVSDDQPEDPGAVGPPSLIHI